MKHLTVVFGPVLPVAEKNNFVVELFTFQGPEKIVHTKVGITKVVATEEEEEGKRRATKIWRKTLRGGVTESYYQNAGKIPSKRSGRTFSLVEAPLTIWWTSNASNVPDIGTVFFGFLTALMQQLGACGSSGNTRQTCFSTAKLCILTDFMAMSRWGDAGDRM